MERLLSRLVLFVYILRRRSRGWTWSWRPTQRTIWQVTTVTGAASIVLTLLLFWQQNSKAHAAREQQPLLEVSLGESSDKESGEDPFEDPVVAAPGEWNAPPAEQRPEPFEAVEVVDIPRQPVEPALRAPAEAPEEPKQESRLADDDVFMPERNREPEPRTEEVALLAPGREPEQVESPVLTVETREEAAPEEEPVADTESPPVEFAAEPPPQTQSMLLAQAGQPRRPRPKFGSDDDDAFDATDRKPPAAAPQAPPSPPKSAAPPEEPSPVRSKSPMDDEDDGEVFHKPERVVRPPATPPATPPVETREIEEEPRTDPFAGSKTTVSPKPKTPDPVPVPRTIPARPQTRHEDPDIAPVNRPTEHERTAREQPVPVPVERQAPESYRRASGARLALEINVPKQIAVGERVTMQFRVTNIGKAPADEVVVYDELPESLRHAKTNDLEWKIGRLMPGETRTGRLKFQALRPGLIHNQAIVTAEGQMAGEASAELEVIQQRVDVDYRGPAQALYGCGSIFSAEIGNPGRDPLRQVTVTSTVPAGATFEGASDGGQFDPETRTVVWRLRQLPPGVKQVLEMKVVTRSLGAQESIIRVRDAGGDAGRGRAEINVACPTRISMGP